MSRKVVYWDSSAFLALLKGENNHGPDILNILKSQAGAFDRGEITLAMSTIGILEVLSANIPDSVRENFEKIIRRNNFTLVSANETVMRNAALIRHHVYGKAKNGGGESYILSVPDAIHVASAMLVEADVLVTLDTRNKSKTKELGMTAVASYYPISNLHSVSIERPALGQAGTGLIP